MTRSLLHTIAGLLLVGTSGCLMLPGAGEEDTGVVPDEDANVANGVTPDLGPARDAPDAGVDSAPDGSTFVDVVAGNWHACALADDGRLACWGSNWQHQSDPDTTDDPIQPRWVLPDHRFETIAAGNYRMCGITTDAALLCWGRNARDVVRTDDEWIPPQFIDLMEYTVQPIADVSIGGEHMCVQVTEAAYCWGDNQYWQVDPNGETTGFVPPTRVPTGVQVFAAAAHTCSLNANNRAACWGHNSSMRVSPRNPYQGNINAETIDNSNYSLLAPGTSHTCGIRGNGSVACWGSESGYRLGKDFNDIQSQPVIVPMVADAVDLDVATSACVVTGMGEVVCWGPSHDVLDGPPKSFAPVDGSPFERVAVGSNFVCATSATGVWCWGENDQQGGAGQFEGDAPAGDVLVPTRVPTPDR